MEIFSNYGECVDVYAPGIDVYSADLGEDDASYKLLRGTSMSTAVITGLIANMLWVDNDLTMEQIKNHLKGYYHSYNVQLAHYPQCQSNGCHLVHWNCDSYNVELLAYDISMTESTTTYEPQALYTDIDLGLDLDFYSTDYPTMNPTNDPTINPTVTPTVKPTTKPSLIRADDDLMKLCCNAKLNKHLGICKPKYGENECILNKKCYWDDDRCLDEPCSGRKTKCKSNDECCSNVCVRFRGISHCT